MAEITLQKIDRDLDDDVRFCAQLIYYIDPFLAGRIFGFDQQKAVDRISQAIRHEHNAFSHNYITIAKKKEEPIGFWIGYAVAEKDSWKRTSDFISALGIKGYVDFLIRRMRLPTVESGRLTDDTFYLSNIAVHHEFRGNGYGTLLLEDLLAHAANSDTSAIALDVRADKEPAQGLFRKFDFEEVYRDAFDIAGDRYEYIRMATSL